GSLPAPDGWGMVSALLAAHTCVERCRFAKTRASQRPSSTRDPIKVPCERPRGAARRRPRYIWTERPGGRANSMSRKVSSPQQQAPEPRRRERRRFLRGLCGAGLAAAALGAAPRRLLAQAASGDLTAVPLRDGLVLVGGAGGNVVVLDTPEGLVMVDSGAPASAAELARFLAERYPRAPVEVLLNTHWHLEHTGGNDRIGATGATIVAHENTRL